jgi:O-antigen ligase
VAPVKGLTLYINIPGVRPVKSIEQRRPDYILSAVFPILVVFLFAVFTSLPEFTPGLREVRPLLFLGALGLLAVGVTGRFMKVMKTPAGKALTLFTVWFILCIPLAIWRGGSFVVLEDYWSKSFLAFVLTAGLISTAAESKKIFHTIAYGVGFLGISALAFHRYTSDGRLCMPGGRYSNSNDLAWTLLVGLVFLAYLYLQSRGTRKVIALVLAAPVLLALSRTGSRALLIGTAVLFLYVFFQSTGATRAKMIIAVPIVFVVLIMMMPNQLRDRYTTLFEKKDPSQLTTAEIDASGSSETRLELLMDSITLTLNHPFFGVGPGNFQVGQANLAISRGEPYGLWHVTHNTYTELSSEMGVPGLLIYVAFLIQCWRMLSSVIRRKYVSKDVRVMAKTLQAAFLVMVTVAFFESFGYDTNIPIVAGLITALSFVARDQRSRQDSREKIEEPPTQLPEPEYEPAWSGRLY